MTSIPTDLSPSERSDDAMSNVAEVENSGGWPISNGLIVGALAGLVASGLMLWIGRSWGGSIVAQLMAERTTAELPLSVVRDSIQNLEENAKPVALIGITIGQVIAAALGALVYGRFAGSTPRQRILGSLALSGVAWLVLSVVAAPIGGIGLFALDSPLGVGKTHLNFIITSIAYGVMVAAMVPWPQSNAVQADDGRRNVLRSPASVRWQYLRSGQRDTSAYTPIDFEHRLTLKRPFARRPDLGPSKPQECRSSTRHWMRFTSYQRTWLIRPCQRWTGV